MIEIRRGRLHIKGAYGSNYARGHKSFDLTTDDMTGVSIDMNLVAFIVACVAHENGIKGATVEKLLKACKYEETRT